MSEVNIFIYFQKYRIYIWKIWNHSFEINYFYVKFLSKVINYKDIIDNIITISSFDNEAVL